MAGQYDEWFFSDVDANGNPTLPKDFVANKNAQSFLHFGTDPEGQDVRAADTVYTETIDGQEAMRVIYNPAIIQPLVPFQPAAPQSQRSPSSNRLWVLPILCLPLIKFGSGRSWPTQSVWLLSSCLSSA